MGVELDTMSLWLINRKISTVNDTMIKALNPREAKFSRDALAKHIYSCLFNWIVTKLNKANIFNSYSLSLSLSHTHARTRGYTPKLP